MMSQWRVSKFRCNAEIAYEAVLFSPSLLQMPPPKEKIRSKDSGGDGVSLSWADISAEELTKYMTLNTVQEKLGFLAKKFDLEQYQSDSRKGILLDFYFYTLSFALNKGFNAEKTSTIFSILKSVHTASMADPFCTLDQAFENFKQLLVKHSVSRPPFSVEIFSLEDVKKITDYATESYFRHYKLYRYAFTKKQVTNVNLLELRIEEPPSIPPLSEAQQLSSNPLADERKDAMAKQEAKTAQEIQQRLQAQELAAQQALERLASMQAAGPRVSEEEKESASFSGSSASQALIPPSEVHNVPEIPTPSVSAPSETEAATGSPVSSSASQPVAPEQLEEASIPSSSSAPSAKVDLAREIERLVAESSSAMLQNIVKDVKEEMLKRLKAHEDQLTARVTKLVEGSKTSKAKQLSAVA